MSCDYTIITPSGVAVVTNASRHTINHAGILTIFESFTERKMTYQASGGACIGLGFENYKMVERDVQSSREVASFRHWDHFKIKYHTTNGDQENDI